MAVVLGLDAAWTTTGSSGVALLVEEVDHWRWAAVAPSYASFLELARGGQTEWRERFTATPPDPHALLVAARTLSDGREVDLVTIDMPVSTIVIQGRREADSAISRAFGAALCSTHSPSPSRPGPLGHRLAREFAALGYPVATTTTTSGDGRRLVEVYPHVALLSLLAAACRIQYKIGRARAYWPDRSIAEQIVRLTATFAAIGERLAACAAGWDLSLPELHTVPSRAFLKRYEDALDAAISAWVGAQYLAGRATAYGNATAAIWVPHRTLVSRPGF
jgi:predicted RNase H-like nuclease